MDQPRAVGLADCAVDDVRGGVGQETLGQRGRKGNPFVASGTPCCGARKGRSPQAWERIFTGLAAGDAHGDVGAALVAEELFREAWAVASPPKARRRLVAPSQWCAEAEGPEPLRLARTISAWEDEVLAS